MKLVFYCQEKAPANPVNYLDHGSSGTVAALMLASRGLAARGHDVHVLNPSSSGIYGAVNYHETHNESDMRAHLERLGRPDVFIANGFAVSAILNAGVPAGKTVYWNHNFVDQTPCNQAIHAGRLNYIVCVSENQMGTWWRSPYFDRICQIYNAVDSDAISRGQAGSGESARRIIFVGAPRACKGFDDAVRVFLEFRKKYPDFEFVVAGSASLHGIGNGSQGGIFEPEYENQVLANLIYDERRNLKDGITLLGNVPKKRVWSYLQSSKAILLNPSWTSQPENQSMAAMEAQVLGVPVVSTFRGGMPEVVANGKSGVLVRRRGIGHLVDALKEVVEKEGSQALIRASIRPTIRERFGIDRIAENWDASLQRMAGGGRFEGNRHRAARRKFLRLLRLG
jgi:glycosyltransferase involved in cell wall biosynthesis